MPKTQKPPVVDLAPSDDEKCSIAVTIAEPLFSNGVAYGLVSIRQSRKIAAVLLLLAEEQEKKLEARPKLIT